MVLFVVASDLGYVVDDLYVVVDRLMLWDTASCS
jgi:hypothetical protein